MRKGGHAIARGDDYSSKVRSSASSKKKKEGMAGSSSEGVNNSSNLSRYEEARVPIKVEKCSKNSIENVLSCHRLARFDEQIHNSTIARRLRDAGQIDIEGARGNIAKSQGEIEVVGIHGVGNRLMVVADSKAKAGAKPPNKYRSIL